MLPAFKIKIEKSRRETLIRASRLGVLHTSKSAEKYFMALENNAPEGYSAAQKSVYKAMNTYHVRSHSDWGNQVYSNDLGANQILPSASLAEYEISEDVIVGIDILLETLGFVGLRNELISEFIKSEPDLEASVEQAILSISTKDWEAASKSIEGLFKLFAGYKFFQRIPIGVVKKGLMKMSLHAVPLVGWVYLIASFIVSIKINYRRFSYFK